MRMRKGDMAAADAFLRCGAEKLSGTAEEKRGTRGIFEHMES